MEVKRWFLWVVWWLVEVGWGLGDDFAWGLGDFFAPTHYQVAVHSELGF